METLLARSGAGVLPNACDRGIAEPAARPDGAGSAPVSGVPQAGQSSVVVQRAAV